jgi:SAM-dependent methyltransferase
MSLSAAIRSIADESRMRIVHLLTLGSFNVQELTSVFGTSQSTISHHLKSLQAAGVLRGRKDGTWSYFSIASQTPEGLLARELSEKVATEEGTPYSDDLTQGRELLNRRRDKSKLLFDSLAHSWPELRQEAHGNVSFLDELASRIPTDEILLELGCGSGALFEKLLPRSAATIGVDSSPAMLEQARKVTGKDKVDLRLGLLEHLPVADESVDRAVAYMVLHHVAEIERALADTLRVLRPGGTLMLVERSAYNSAAMRERFGEQWVDFSAEQLRELVASAGFRDVVQEELGGNKEAFLLMAKKSLP